MTTSTLAPPMREYKSLFGAETKVLSDEGEGIVEMIVSVTGIEDHVGDIIVPGAYEKTLDRRWPKGVSHHDWETPVAKALNIRELKPGDADLPRRTARGEPWPADAGAVMVKAQFNLDTEAGRDAYSNVKFYENEQEWSIGYNVPRNGSRMVKGIRFIDELDWYEFSDVLFGAMPLAGTHAVKALGGLVVGGGHPSMLGTTDTLGETKALPGSYEERSRMVEQAVSSNLVGAKKDDSTYAEYVTVKATFDDHAVVCHYKEGQPQDYEVTYAIVGDEVTLGAPRAVKVIESVVPMDAPAEDAVESGEYKQEPKPYEDKDPDEDDEDKPKPAADEAKPEAADGDAKAPDDEEDDEDKDAKKQSKSAYLSPSEIAAMDEFRALA